MALRRGSSLAGLAKRGLGQLLSELNSAGCSVQAETSGLLNGSSSVGGVRHASQLAVKQRMRSVQNIAKITSAMKMVAASKMRVAQLQTEKSRGLLTPFLKMLGDLPAVEVEHNLTVPVSTDKGLCGGINSTVSRYARGTIATFDGEGQENDLVVLGEKGRAQLARDRAKYIKETVADTQKVRITFSQVSAIADDLMKTEYDVVRIIFNRFQSAISFKPTIATVLSPDALEKEVEAGGKLDQYETEGPDRAEMLQDLAEFQLAATLNNALLENNCSEQASRMSAMESSTKNAKEMLEKLTLSYNRTRQAAITTELTEIISGAAALEG